MAILKELSYKNFYLIIPATLTVLIVFFAAQENEEIPELTIDQSSVNLEVSIKNNKYTKVAIKRYLYSHVRSNFLRVNVNEMALAAYLPVAQFQGKTIGGVFAAARKNF